MNSPRTKTVFLIQFLLKILAFSVFAAKILSRRSRLSRWSRAPFRLIRPRPIDCDGGHDRQTMISRFFEEENHKKKVVFSCPPSNPTDLHPKKETHSRIFVTGGSVIAWQMLVKEKYYSDSRGGQLYEYNTPTRLLRQKAVGACLYMPAGAKTLTCTLIIEITGQGHNGVPRRKKGPQVKLLM